MSNRIAAAALCATQTADPLACGGGRAERKEIFDEIEEWTLIQEHYCIALGVNDRDGLFADFGFETFPQTHPVRRLPFG